MFTKKKRKKFHGISIFGIKLIGYYSPAAAAVRFEDTLIGGIFAVIGSFIWMNTHSSRRDY